MKIIVSGSREEIAGFIKRLIADKLNAEKKTDFPPLLTELANEPSCVRDLGNRGYMESINQSPRADKENAPQTETAEQKIRDFANTLQSCLTQANQKN